MKNKIRFLAMMLIGVLLSVNQVWGEYTLITDPSDLSNGDIVVIAQESNGSPTKGVTGQSGTKDAATSTTEANWMLFTVVNASNSNFQLKNGDSYISPASSEFKLAATGKNLSCDEDGWLTWYSGTYTYYLYQNSSYYRFYQYNTNYTPFLVFKKSVSCAAPTATSKGITTKNSQVVSWTDASGSAWDVYCSTSSTTPTTQTTATNLSTKSYTFTGLTPATKYYWWVRANCGSSTSSWVAGTAFTTNSITYTDFFSELKIAHFYRIFMSFFLAYVKQPLSMV